VPALAAPGGEVDRQRRMTAGHRQPPAGRQLVERAVDQQMAALVETQVRQVSDVCAESVGVNVGARHGGSPSWG
jgi:hypothetical protein